MLCVWCLHACDVSRLYLRRDVIVRVCRCVTGAYLTLACVYIIAFSIDKKQQSDATGEADEAEQVMRTFAMDVR